MLISKTVIMKWHPGNKKWYEGKDYIFTNWKDEFEVRVEDLPDGSNIFVEVKCDGLNCTSPITKPMKWHTYKIIVHKDNTYYCKKCASQLFGIDKIKKLQLQKSISFYQWCYNNLPKKLADLILERWDYELNIDKNGKVLTPKDVTYSSAGLNQKGYWFKCLINSEHKSEQKHIVTFVRGAKSLDCNQCNSISITHPHLIKYLVNIEDAFEYSFGSDKDVFLKCPDCRQEKKMKMKTLVNCGFACPKCSDGISYPNKFMFNVLDQLKNLNKINEFETEKSFDWLQFEFKEKFRKGFIDFYFGVNGKMYGIEMDGGFHEKDNNMNGQTKEESKFIDNEKDRVCQEHDIKVIRIDSLKSEWEYIKNSAINSVLPQVINFAEEDIDWLKCHKYACSSLVKTICDLWNNGINNVTKIVSELKIGKKAIIKYLKQGTKLGWCDYDPKVEINKNFELIHKNNCRKVICLTTGEVFSSQKEAGEKYNINPRRISDCCNNKIDSIGSLKTGEKLIWKFYNDYLKELSEKKDSSFIFGGG